MSRAHRCVGDGCGFCEQAIAAAEDARDFPEGADYQDHAEQAFDRLGGIA